MSKILIHLVLVLPFVISSSTYAATIIWVSDNESIAQPWIDLLVAEGYTVDLGFRSQEGRDLDPAKINALNAADLIIIGADISLDAYNDGAEIAQWSSITTPLILQKGRLARNKNWLWFNAGGARETVVDMEAVDPAHPVFTDVATPVSVLTKASDFAKAEDVGNGKVIAKQAAGDGYIWIAEWEAGQEFYSGSGQIAGGPRMYFAAGSVNNGEYNLTVEGEKILLNAVRYMLGDTIEPGKASVPKPGDKATDVPRDVILSWTPGELTSPINGHRIYLSENFDEVNNGVGGILQSANSYAPPQRLDLDKTYYWRVDEISAPPDSTVFQGDVWSFTTEPVGYPIRNITATASSSAPGQGPENTVNGSGLTDDLHDIVPETMWLSESGGPQPTWIQFDFDKVYKLRELWVWNSNTRFETGVGYGAREVLIEYSVDGVDYVTLGSTHEFSRAPAELNYAHNTSIDLGGLQAKHFKFTIHSNWGGFLPQFGLSEVRFFHTPVRAREPSPEFGATDVHPAVTLSWRAGREAATHDVYLSTEEQAVAEGSAPVVNIVGASYSPALDLASTYFWRIDEVNEAETPATWQGDVWDFSTSEYLVVDDFESYNDIDPPEPESHRIFESWSDGFGIATNGALIGHDPPQPSYTETVTVRGGTQSIPLFYDNTDTARYSEAELTLNPPQDWTRHGAEALSLWFSGDPNNVHDQMYVKINGSKVTYDSDADNLARIPWQPWNIDLASLGIDLQNVTKFSVGFGEETSMIPGGSGVVYFDDVRLYPYSRESVTPTEPSQTGLVAHYEFEGNTDDSSGNGRNGTARGNPTFVAGKNGQAINFRGLNDYVEITGYKGILGPSAVTVTAWIKTTAIETGTIVGWGPDVEGQRFGFRIDEGRLRIENAAGNLQGHSNVNDGGWHHVAVTVQENATISYPEVIFWLEGIDDTRLGIDPDAFNLTADQDVSIGRCPASNDRFFMGQIDDVRIYERALGQEEIAWLAGRTKPFDKPF